MAGKEGGVQAILRKKIKKALFFTVLTTDSVYLVNDLNKIDEVENVFSITKDVVNFFFENQQPKNMLYRT